jgi:TonB family protein
MRDRLDHSFRGCGPIATPIKGRRDAPPRLSRHHRAGEHRLYVHPRRIGAVLWRQWFHRLDQLGNDREAEGKFRRGEGDRTGFARFVGRRHFPSLRPTGVARFGVVSALVHMGALVALTASGARMIAPPPPDEAAVAVVFQSIAAPLAVPELAVPEPAIGEPNPAPPSLTLPRDLPKPVLTKPTPPPKPARELPVYAVPLPSLPAPAAGPTEPTPAIDPSWQSSVSAWLAAHKTYPDGARRRQEEGRVVISFTVDRFGRVLAVEVAESSRSERLDEATLALLRNASLPAFPPSMGQARVTVTMTVRFTLR